MNCKDVNDNHRKDAIYELAMPSEVGNNRGEKPNIFQIGFAKAISRGMDVRHCGICNNYYKCRIEYNVEKFDKRTGQKVIVSDWVYNANIPEDNMDKVIQANGCSKYSYSRYFVQTELGKLNNMINWEWKRG